MNQFPSNSRQLILLIVIVLLFISIRIVLLNQKTILEDHDSTSYIHHISSLKQNGIAALQEWDADSMPVYPMFASVFHFMGFTPEMAARLCSFFFSIILFLSLYLIIDHLHAKFWTKIICLTLFSLNYGLALLSVSVLTELTYIAITYLALSIFLLQINHPSLKIAVVIGAVLGLSFLTRTEGIILIVIPLSLQFFHFIYFKEIRTYTLKYFFIWASVLSITYCAFITPQIYNISKKMGRPAINGRQVWVGLLTVNDGKSYEEKIFGLDFSPSLINIRFLQDNKEASDAYFNKHGVSNAISFFSSIRLIKKMLRNLNEFFSKRIDKLIGPIGLIFVAFGIFSFYREKTIFPIMLGIIFTVVSMAGPLVHNVAYRHVAILIPLLIIYCAMGIVYLFQNVHTAYYRWFALICIAVCIFFNSLTSDLRGFRSFFLDPAHANPEHANPQHVRNISYSPSELAPFIDKIKTDIPPELLGKPVICSRKNFISVLSTNSLSISLPYCNFTELVEYCKLNGVLYLYLDYDKVKNYPFADTFLSGSYKPFFTSMLTMNKESETRSELFKFNQNIISQNK